jgi:hypothetical protein
MEPPPARCRKLLGMVPGKQAGLCKSCGPFGKYFKNIFNFGQKIFDL